MRRSRFLLSILTKLFMNSCSDLIGLLLVLEHCLQLALSLAAEQENNLQNDSSSRVRPEVSGKKK